jgi:eukaryotic-like serine/threonine-protein kinase
MPARTLKPEDLISHYRIVGPIGAGGMGEVYRAQDQSLERDVALKILPPELVQSEERVRRFVLEAKSASSLNHPHIITIYEIGQDRVHTAVATAQPEPDSSPLHFISMELVTGETLTTKIHREKCDLKTLLGYLAQAAEGLAKAHAAGIVHRDLKPGNIMVSRDGYAKVLDFGLAKLTERQALDPAVTSAPTQTGEDTGAGVVLGTVHYMSPEQVQGKSVDHRSDIFSFGCILYEAATGRRPFAAESDVETMHKILREEPEPVQTLNPQAPAELRRLIRRCLVKNPDQRLDSMRTLAIELREIIEEYESLSATPSPGSGVPPIAVKHRRSAALWVGLSAAAVACIATAVILFAQAPPRLGAHMTFRTLPTPTSKIGYPGLSPDGKWIAFGAADERNHWDVYLTNVNGGEIRRITADSSAEVQFVDISPDGSRLVYSDRDNLNGPRNVRVVSALGGPSTVLGLGNGPRWSRDGSKIGFIRVEDRAGDHRVFEFHTVQPDGSDPRLVFADSITILGEQTRTSFAWSPDGRQIAWLRNFQGPYEELAVHDLATGRERLLTHDRKIIDEVHWTRQNQIVFSSNRGGNMNLWVIRASGGKPTQLTRGSGPDVGMRVSADGTRLLYLQNQETNSLWISSTRSWNPIRVTHDELRLGLPSISPDGKIIAVPILREALGSAGQIYLMNRDGSGRRPVTPNGWWAAAPRWSPDGRLAFWGRAPEDSPDSNYVYILDPRGGGGPRRLTGGAFPVWLDSTSLLVLRGPRRWLISTDGSHAEPIGQDSTSVMPAKHRRYALVFDRRAGREGTWIRVPGMGPESLATYRRFLDGVTLSPPYFATRGADFLLHFPAPGRADRVSLPDLRHTRIPGTITDFDPISSPGNLRWDGEELVYAEPEVSSKMVLIDNFR